MRERRLVVRRAAVTAAAAATLAALSLSGCSKMDAALGKQWMTVDFGPNTTVGAALQVRAACSHIPDTPPLPLPVKHTAINVMYGIRFDTTNSNLAEMAELQTCLQKFKSVQGVSSEDTGDEGG